MSATGIDLQAQRREHGADGCPSTGDTLYAHDAAHDWHTGCTLHARTFFAAASRCATVVGEGRVRAVRLGPLSTRCFVRCEARDHFMHGATAWRGKQSTRERSFIQLEDGRTGRAFLSWASFFITINTRIANLEQLFPPGTTCSASTVGVVTTSSQSRRLRNARTSSDPHYASADVQSNLRSRFRLQSPASPLVRRPPHRKSAPSNRATDDLDLDRRTRHHIAASGGPILCHYAFDGYLSKWTQR
jgi:hypothetical protein